MSRDYAENRIKEALRMHGGNVARARQQVIAWTFEDAKLLHALARPHLTGIVAYQVDRVASGRAELEKRKPAAPKASAQDENFGLEILRALGMADHPVFGQESAALPIKRGAASKQHIDAIHKIAAKSSQAKKD